MQPRNESKPWDEQINMMQPTSSKTVPAATKKIVVDTGQLYVNTSYYGLDYTATNKHGNLRWTQNGISYKFPSTPLLLASYYDMLDSSLYEAASRPIRVELGEVVDVVIQNRAASNNVCEQHPWHIHGNKWWVLGYGEGLYNSSDEYSLNTVNPISVDTFVSYPTTYGKRRGSTFMAAPSPYSPCGWTVLRFQANNPGIWLMHCHVAWHLTMGMALVFDIASEELWKSATLPADYGFCGLITSNTARSSTSVRDIDTDTDTSVSLIETLSRESIVMTMFAISIASVVSTLIFAVRALVNNCRLRRLMRSDRDSDVAIIQFDSATL
jgi:hypothetical protein